jgi:superoxide dismutase
MALASSLHQASCYRYSALEPHVSAEIMELHHSKHHNTYVTSYNKLLEEAKEAEQKADSQAMPKLTKGLNFHGGGAQRGALHVSDRYRSGTVCDALVIKGHRARQ